MGKYIVAVIGCGNLGRRHFQSLALCDSDIEIYAVDPSSEMLELTEKIAEDNELSHKTIFVRSISEIINDIDLAIVATTAPVRLNIFSNLLKKNTKNIVLEKVAFNSVKDIDKAKLLFSRYSSNVWVNCPRREYEIYSDLKKKLKGTKLQTLSVSGNNFGLGCNGIHFIDLASYLVDDTKYKIDFVNITDIIESKRGGFVEFYGHVSGVFSTGARFNIDSMGNEDKTNYSIRIELDEGEVVIDEINGTIKESIQGIDKNYIFSMPYQSQLTGPMVDSIIANGNCELIGFSDSMEIHTPFVELMYNQYSVKYGSNDKKMVPIT